MALAVVFALSCHRTKTESPEPTLGRNWIGALEIIEEDVPPTNLLKVKPADLARHIEAIYRLKPDRRFVYAISEVDRVLGGRPQTAFVHHLVNGGWELRLGQTNAGRLPELPTFAEGLELVRRWAAQEWQGRKARSKREANRAEVARLKGEIWHSSYLGHLRAVDKLNSLAAKAPDDGALMGLAADALLALTLETQDSMEILDPLLGRAMTLLALSEVASGVPAEARSLSVLAYQLGYETEAVDLASSLGAEDPWHLFLNRDTARLQALWATRKDPFVLVLAMKAFAARANKDGVLAIGQAAGIAEPPSFSFLAALVAAADFSIEPDVDRRFAEEALHLAVDTRLPTGDAAGRSYVAWLRALWNRIRGHVLVVPLEGRLREFEEAVGRQAQRLDGPLVDKVTLASLLRAPLYAALLAEANYYFDRLSSTPAATEWVAAITDPPPGIGTELKRWAEDRVMVRNGAPGGVQRIGHDLATLRELGVGPVVRITYSLSNSVTLWWDPAIRRPVRAMFDGLDTRPTHLVAAAMTAKTLLWDLKRYQRYAVAAAQRAPGALASPDFAFVLENVKDKELLWRVAGRADLPTSARATALLLLLDAEPDKSGAVLAGLRTLADQAGPDASVGLLYNLVWALERLNRRSEADGAIDDWLATRGESAGLGRFAMLAFKAGRLRQEGRIRSAWQVIEPTLDSWKGDCLSEATRILLTLGRCDEALEIAQAAAKRYPEDESSQAAVAQVLWRLGRPQDAATFLKKAFQHAPDRVWSYDVASAFASEFGGSNLGEANKAFEELKAAGVSNLQLRYLGVGVGQYGDRRLAFAMLASLSRADTTAWDAVLYAFKELRQTDGPEAALAWLRTRLPVLTDPIVIQAYQIGADDLVWDYPGEPSRQEKSAMWCLLRAAAYCRAPHPDSAHRETILESCRRQKKTAWTSIYPRYLIGDVDDSSVLSIVEGMEGICTVAWMFGTRRACEGNAVEANDWYEVAMETGKQALPPYGYSYALMAKWAGAGKFLDEIGRQRLLN